MGHVLAGGGTGPACHLPVHKRQAQREKVLMFKSCHTGIKANYQSELRARDYYLLSFLTGAAGLILAIAGLVWILAS